MSDKARANLNTSLLWAIFITMVGGLVQAGRVYIRMEAIEREIARVRPLEEEVIKIKAHLKISARHSTAETFGATDNQRAFQTTRSGQTRISSSS